MKHVQALRDGFWQVLRDRLGDQVVLNGHATHCLPNTLNVSFVGKIGADILGQLSDVAASTGSACHSGRIELSPVLAAMGVPERIGMGAIRFSLGRVTTSEEIDDVVARLKERGLTSPYLKPFVVARINPLRFKRDASEPIDDLLPKMTAAAKKFDVSKVRADELSRAAGPPPAEEEG